MNIVSALIFLIATSLPVHAQTLPYSPYPSHMDISPFVQIWSLQALNPGAGACKSYTNNSRCTKGQGTILILGDSITNQIYHAYSACGYNVFFAGVNGAEAHDFLPHVNAIVSATLPEVIVVALGKNDMTDPNLSYWNWQQDYFWLVDDLESATQTYEGRTIRPVLMSILPPERSAPAPWNNPGLLAEYNGYIDSNTPAQGNNVAAVMGSPFVDYSNPPAGVTPIVTDGPYLTPGFTYPGDGLYIHPVGSNNAILWQYYQAAISAGLAEIGVTCNATPPPMVP